VSKPLTDVMALVRKYGDARAGKALHNGDAQRASCDVSLSAVQDEVDALRSALAAAEAKLAAADLDVRGMADIRARFKLRPEMHGLDVAIVLDARLADERKHLDDAAFLLDKAFEFGDLCDQIHAEDCPQDDTCECPEAQRLNRVMLYHDLRKRKEAAR